MKEKLLLISLIFLNIFFLSCIVLILVFYPQKQQQEDSGSEVLSKVVALESNDFNEENFTVSVCGEGSCMHVSSQGLFTNGFVDESKLYSKVTEEIIPHFEKISGGNDFVSNRAGGFVYWKEDEVLDLGNISKDMYEAFLSRMDTEIFLEKKDLPGTDGTYADKYIEVDNSKQKLYAWMGGQVEKEILLSAAKDGFQVYGVFPIVDKGREPLSPADSYMPYWMAFYHSPKQDSWYGLHALIWWYDDDGKKVYESEEHIGVRRSGGCIRMLLDDAKYLYDNYEKGDPILIHE